MRVGPIAPDLLDKILSGDRSILQQRYGVLYRNHGMRVLFERHQSPSVRQRRVGGSFAQLLFAIYTAADDTQAGAIGGPLFYRVFSAVFTAGVVSFFFFQPLLARRTGFAFLADSRFLDPLFFLCIATFLLTLWGNFDDLQSMHGEMQTTIEAHAMVPDRAQHSLRLVGFAFVVAAGSVFLNPLYSVVASVLAVAVFCRRYNRIVDASVFTMNTTALASHTGHEEAYLNVSDFWVHFVIALVFIAHQVHSATAQFRLECTIQIAAARRIEQLGNEKERLDYELRMEEVRLEAVARQLAADPLPSRPGACNLDTCDATDASKPPAALGAAAAHFRGADPRDKALAASAADGTRSVEPHSSHPLEPPVPRLGHARGRAAPSLGGESTVASCEELGVISEAAGVLCTPGEHAEKADPDTSRSSDTSSGNRPSAPASGESSSQGGAAAASSSNAQFVPLAVVRVESQLNWSELQKLRALRSLKRPSPSASDNRSEDHSEVAMGSVSGAAEPVVATSTCATRDAVLWRTLRRSGLISPASTSAVSRSTRDPEQAIS